MATTTATNDDAVYILDNPTFEWTFKDENGDAVNLTSKTPRIHLRFTGEGNTVVSLDKVMTADADQTANTGKATYTMLDADWTGVKPGFVEMLGLFAEAGGNDFTGPDEPHILKVKQRIA